jgi:hypothetical protein
MVQLPRMNTPQFDWCQSKMPNRAQPVPPIYQPEIAANAVVYAATHKRREIYVGLPTAEAIWGNRFIAGWLDRMLARSNYQAQQTDEPEGPSRPSNLWEPAKGDYGAHGRFVPLAQCILQAASWLNPGLLSLSPTSVSLWIEINRGRPY